MQLLWRPVSIDDGPLISTSLTEREAAKLAELAKEHRSVLEVGSAFGYSSVLMAKAGAWHVVAIDPHSQIPNSFETMRGNLRAYEVQEKVSIMVASSRVAMSVLRALGATFELIFIDGDHEEFAVYWDLVNALDLIVKGHGAIAIHDYGEQTCPGVKAATDRWLANKMGVTPKMQLVDTLMVVKL